MNVRPLNDEQLGIWPKTRVSGQHRGITYRVGRGCQVLRLFRETDDPVTSLAAGQFVNVWALQIKPQFCAKVKNRRGWPKFPVTVEHELSALVDLPHFYILLHAFSVH